MLVTLRSDVEFEFDAESCKFDGLNADPLKKHFELLGFRNLMARLGLDSTGEGTETDTVPVSGRTGTESVSSMPAVG